MAISPEVSFNAAQSSPRATNTHAWWLLLRRASCNHRHVAEARQALRRHYCCSACSVYDLYATRRAPRLPQGSSSYIDLLFGRQVCYRAIRWDKQLL